MFFPFSLPAFQPFKSLPAEFLRNLPFQLNSWSAVLKRDLSWVLLSNADNLFDVYQSFSFVRWMDFIYLYLAAGRKIFKASRRDFKNIFIDEKSKSFTFKENKREHEVYTWTHIISKKKKGWVWDHKCMTLTSIAWTA